MPYSATSLLVNITVKVHAPDCPLNTEASNLYLQNWVQLVVLHTYPKIPKRQDKKHVRFLPVAQNFNRDRDRVKLCGPALLTLSSVPSFLVAAPTGKSPT